MEPAIANLAAHLEGRPLLPKTDFTSADLRGELLIGAPVERVWQSLTDSAQASAWFGYPIGIEPWVGGRYAMGGFEAGYAAKVVDLEPGHRMSVDWGPTGISTWELAESDGKTKLTFVQSGFDEGNPPYAAWSGSVAGLSELRRYHEMADWQPIWCWRSFRPAPDRPAVSTGAGRTPSWIWCGPRRPCSPSRRDPCRVDRRSSGGMPLRGARACAGVPARACQAGWADRVWPGGKGAVGALSS